MRCSGYYPFLFTSFLTYAHALMQFSWSMTNAPAYGLTDITFPITIVEADHITGYYFAQAFNFVGINGYSLGYTGIQPRPDSFGAPVLHGVFSSFIAGTTTDDPNCHYGADGGPGVSCAVDWFGLYGRQYNFEVRTVGNRRWIGTAVDAVTGVRIHIGSWTLPPVAAGIYGSHNSNLGFVEWFPWNVYKPPNHCARLPYQRTVFGNPWTTNVGSFWMQNVSYEHGDYGDCVGRVDVSYEHGDCVGRVAAQSARVYGGIVNVCGWRGQTGIAGSLSRVVKDINEPEMPVGAQREGLEISRRLVLDN